MSKTHPLIFAVLTFFLSYFIFPYYYLGDQIHYRSFYEDIQHFDFLGGYKAYSDYLGASEPIYYLLVFVFNNVLSKDILMSLINACLGFVLCRVLQTLRINTMLLYSYLINFYFVVLLFAAERLKLGFFFFLLSFLITSRWSRNTIVMLSFFAHLQMLLVVFIQYFSNFLTTFFNKRGNIIKKVFITLLAIGSLAVFIRIMQTSIEAKIDANSHKSGLANIIKPILFYLLSIYYSKKSYLKIFFLFLPLIIASILVGEDRIVIFCYSIFCYFAIRYKNGVNLGFLGVNVYFLYKGIEFLYYIIENGNGFDNS